jgi:hypothetical protein
MKFQRGLRYRSILFNLGVGWEWVVKATLRPLYPRKQTRYSSSRMLSGLQARSGRVRKISLPVGSRSPDLPARREWLCTLHWIINLILYYTYFDYGRGCRTFCFRLLPTTKKILQYSWICG